jgi:hypothetical protein
MGVKFFRSALAETDSGKKKWELEREEAYVRQLDNFRYILITEIINKFMTVMSDPVRAKHVQVFKLKLK